MSTSYPTSTTSTRSNPTRRKWFVDLQLRKQERAGLTTAAAVPSTNDLLLLPVGYSEHGVTDKVIKEDDDHLLAKRSWDIALQPIKQLPMNIIFAWMAGNSLSLMSIMIVVMLFMKPIQVVQCRALLFRVHCSHVSSISFS
jgi:hypothetical protein